MPDRSVAPGLLPGIESELPLEAGQVALWLLPLDDLTESAVKQLSAHLSHEERERNREYGVASLQRRDAACRGLLRDLLARYIGVPANTLSLVRGEHGKPLLAGSDVSVHFNYSHSGSYACFAFTRMGEVGVDIEACGRKANALRIARSYFTDREYRVLAALPESQRGPEFLRYWTLKEAWLKARGEGIFAGLDRFSISLPATDEGDAAVRMASHGNAEDELAFCYTGVAAPGYRFGLVVRDVPGPLSLLQREVRFDGA